MKWSSRSRRRSRRNAITSTPAGGGATTTSYLWCGSSICQARNASNAPTRSYYVEGEFVPGSPAQPYYYGQDQIGSTRRVFTSASSAPAYGYDSYGNALQSTQPLTDFNYAGMFYNADSGLYLTRYRAYDPIAGRWLSRDPLGEQSDAIGNLYPYSGGNPVSNYDPEGAQGATIAGGRIGASVGPWGAAAGIATGAIIDLAGKALADYIFNNRAKPPVPPPTLPDGWDGKTPPFPGWTWHGPDEPGGDRGGWVSPDGSQSLHPDFGHGGKIGPHTDWNDPYGKRWRIFPDGTCEPA